MTMAIGRDDGIWEHMGAYIPSHQDLVSAVPLPLAQPSALAKKASNGTML